MVFLSLGLVRETVAPLGSSDVVSVVVGHLRADLLSAYLLGAILAYALQSSLAAVLMIVTFVSGGLLTVNAGAALVLGANMGGGIVPLILTLSMPAAARRVVIANLVFRGGLSLVALVAMLLWTPDLSPLAPAAHRQVINLHLLFNLGVLLLGLPIAPVLARLARMLLPDRRAPVRAENGTLEPAALEVPGRALACARREVLRMSETILAMLVPALTLYRKWDDAVAREILDAEDEVDRMHFGTKLYLAKLQERSLGADHSRQAMDLAAIANNLEDAGDQISTHMFDMARRMHGEGLVFSNEGWRDLSDFHDRVVSNAQLALDVLSSGDPDLARQLLEEKDHIRNLERELQERHLRRLRDGLAESIETSNLHQETLRALKLINTSLCSVAYPIAEETGLLLSSRLSRREGAATEDETATNDNNTEARA
ncbi:MAG: Na/Pi cotransporter family protein [Alphaproteobacteria bacterium]|nr:MAG: Na/Pi cotransporter family protein [Alphaproteobacteria bacterium]